MKNLFTISLFTMLSFSNTIFATALVCGRDFEDDKTNAGKYVSYANSQLINSELGSLNKVTKTEVDIAIEDAKVIETITENYEAKYIFNANENLIEIEINTFEYEAGKVINFANSSLLALEMDSLKKSKMSIEQIISDNEKLIESVIFIKNAFNLKLSNQNNNTNVNLNPVKY